MSDPDNLAKNAESLIDLLEERITTGDRDAIEASARVLVVKVCQAAGWSVPDTLEGRALVLASAAVLLERE